MFVKTGILESGQFISSMIKIRSEKPVLTSYSPVPYSFFRKHLWADSLSSQDHILQTRKAKGFLKVALEKVESQSAKHHL